MRRSRRRARAETVLQNRVEMLVIVNAPDAACPSKKQIASWLADGPIHGVDGSPPSTTRDRSAT